MWNTNTYWWYWCHVMMLIRCCVVVICCCHYCFHESNCLFVCFFIRFSFRFILFRFDNLIRFEEFRIRFKHFCSILYDFHDIFSVHYVFNWLIEWFVVVDIFCTFVFFNFSSVFNGDMTNSCLYKNIIFLFSYLIE